MNFSREEYIRRIRARLPYLSDAQLSWVDSFARGLDKSSFSLAEYYRSVMPRDCQEKADHATRCMEAIADSLAGGRGLPSSFIADGTVSPPEDHLLLGWDRGGTVVVDTRQMLRLWREAGFRRVKKEDILEGMELCGYCVPRHENPRTTKVDGIRREVVYIPEEQLHRFQQKVS